MFRWMSAGHYSCWPLSVPDLTPPPAPVQSRHGLEAGFQNASRCRGPGCGAIGKAMLEGYCDKCYVKEQSTRLNQVAHRSPHSPPLVVVGACDTFLHYCTSPFVICCLFLMLLSLVFPFLRFSLPVFSTLAMSCWSTVAFQLPIDLSPCSLCLFLWTKSVTEQSNPDLRSNPRPRTRLSAGGVAAVMCPQVAQTSVQSATHVAKAERRAGGRRRPKKSPSSGAGRRAATTTPTKRNRATAMSATTSNRFIAADHIHSHTRNNEDTSLAL